jgi:hypothetical protein
MNADFAQFDRLTKQDRRDVFEACADRLGASTQAVEKDFWVCRTIDALFHGLPSRPKLFFKGGTSLSKGYGLIKRFSEDIDIVLSRGGLGIKAEHDPLAGGQSAKKRKERAEAVKQRCSRHVLGRMRDGLAPLLPMCMIDADDADPDHSSLRVRYPSLFEADPYLKPWVKVECGARSATEPVCRRGIVPYVQTELGRRLHLAVENVTLIRAERTFWEKALILHGVYCGFRDQQRRPQDNNLISRHYYDVAVMRETAVASNAIADGDLLARVREHKQRLFSRAWEKLDEAKPGTLHLVPQADIQPALAADYRAMSGMMFGEPPSFAWLLAALEKLEEDINKRLL